MLLEWQHMISVITTFATVPLYVLIMWALLWRPKLSPFHILMLSQGTADIFCLISFAFLTSLRSSKLLENFYWENRHFLASTTFVLAYFTIFLRCVGITLISVQRYISICLIRTKIEKMMLRTPLLVFVVLHWSSAVLVTTPLLTSVDVTYERNRNFDLRTPPKDLALANMISFILVTVLLVCSFCCYVSVLARILRSKSTIVRTRRQEIRLSIQVTGLMVAFLFVLVYNLGQYILNDPQQTIMLYSWRKVHPIMNTFLSAVQAWMCLFFNNDVQSRLIKLLSCRRVEELQRNSVLCKSSVSALSYPRS